MTVGFNVHLLLIIWQIAKILYLVFSCFCVSNAAKRSVSKTSVCNSALFTRYIEDFNNIVHYQACHVVVSFTLLLPTANKYVESMCEDVIREMRRCCEALSGKSICCSGFNDPKPDNQSNTKTWGNWDALRIIKHITSSIQPVRDEIYLNIILKMFNLHFKMYLQPVVDIIGIVARW